MSNEDKALTDEPQRKAGNLRELLERRARAAPDKTFLISEADGRLYTYEQFDAAVNRTAHLLAERAAIGKGDVVSLLMPNSAEYIIAYFACFKLGALAGPVNSLLKPHEVAFVLANSEAKALLVHSQFKQEIDALRDELPELQHVIEFDDETEATSEFASAEDLPGIALDGDTEAIIIYTSGTSGKPKGCLLTHGNLIANARQITHWLGFTEHDRLLTVMPLFHMNAVSVTTLTPLYAGASTVVSPRFSASRFWQIVSEQEVTSFGSVATMLQMLLGTYPNGVPEGIRTDQLRFAMCGSAPVPAEVLRRFEQTFNCLVIEGYGLSESTCRSTFNPPDERRRPGSCGMAIGNQMKIVDEEGRAVADNDLGEIVLRGENIFKGYYRNPEANASAFRDGWFHTGDIGYRDADGFFYIVDRKSDMIIRGGENIYPREIDELLYRHESVAEAATIGVPEALYGEEVAAFIVLKEGRGASTDELIEYCRLHLADYKCPKTIHFINELPKGPTGKVLKRELVRRFAPPQD